MTKKQNPAMKRVIVDFKKLNSTILDLLVEKYPDGYDDDDVIVFKNAQNEVVECVEVRTEDTIYLVKVSKRLIAAMEDHDEDPDEDPDTDTDISDMDEDMDDMEE